MWREAHGDIGVRRRRIKDWRRRQDIGWERALHVASATRSSARIAFSHRQRTSQMAGSALTMRSSCANIQSVEVAPLSFVSFWLFFEM